MCLGQLKTCLRLELGFLILTGFTHVEKRRPEQELPRLAVPVAPGAQETDVLLDLHVLAGAQQKLLKKINPTSLLLTGERISYG